MLYLSTRNLTEHYTAHHALTKEYAPDGGLFIPFCLPTVSLKNKSFSQIIADILNAFFSARLTAADVDFCVGKAPISSVQLNHKIIVAEFWHNPAGNIGYYLNNIYTRLLQSSVSTIPFGWAKMAIMIAFVYATYHYLLSEGLAKPDESIDFSVPSEDFFMPTVVWYCKQMGLPVSNIICVGDEKNNIWDMVHRGSLSTATSADSLLIGLERTIFGIHGNNQLESFRNCCEQARTYHVPEDIRDKYLSHFFCAVAAPEIAESTIKSVLRSTSYTIDPKAAICFRGIQDYRASTGTGRLTIILSESTPNI